MSTSDRACYDSPAPPEKCHVEQIMPAKIHPGSRATLSINGQDIDVVDYSIDFNTPPAVEFDAGESRYVAGQWYINITLNPKPVILSAAAAAVRNEQLAQADGWHTALQDIQATCDAAGVPTHEDRGGEQLAPLTPQARVKLLAKGDHLQGPPVLWMDYASGRFISGYMLGYSAPCPATYVGEEVETSDNADEQMQDDGGGGGIVDATPGPALALQHSIEDGLAESLKPIDVNDPYNDAARRPGLSLADMEAADVCIHCWPGDTSGCEACGRPAAKSLIYNVATDNAMADAAEFDRKVQRNLAKALGIPEHVSATTEPEGFADSDEANTPAKRLAGRFALAKASWSPIDGRYIVDGGPIESYSDDAGDLLIAAHIRKLRDDIFRKWRIIDQTTGESIPAIRSHPDAKLPRGFPAPTCRILSRALLTAHQLKHRRAIPSPEDMRHEDVRKTLEAVHFLDDRYGTNWSNAKLNIVDTVKHLKAMQDAEDEHQVHERRRADLKRIALAIAVVILVAVACAAARMLAYPAFAH